MIHPPTCSCGVHSDHKVARRLTADGKTVVLWSDGQVTGAFNAIRGIGRARTRTARRLNLRAGWLVFADVELYDFDEVPGLVRAARQGVRQYNATEDSARAFMRQRVKRR